MSRFSSRKPEESGPPDPKALREYAIRLLAVQSRSETEIARKLGRRGADEATVAAILADLRERRFVDDEALARRVVEARGVSRGKGALAFELRKRGVDPTDALAERTDDEERDAAWRAAVRKAGDPPVVQGWDGRNKLAAHLQRRGFSMSTIRHVLDRTLVEKVVDGADDATDLAEEPWESD